MKSRIGFNKQAASASRKAEKDKPAFYPEKVVYLPESFQANDDQRKISEKTPARLEAGLPELITYSMEESGAPTLLSELKARLARNRTSYPLFDTDRIRRHLESAYLTMWARHQHGTPPASFVVEAVS